MSAVPKLAKAAVSSLRQRVDGCDWDAATSDLNAVGCVVLPGLLTQDECGDLAALYPDDKNFRSHIHMARHGFGKGEYKYFSYPLPEFIADLRTTLYARLAPFANAWNERMNIAAHYPAAHADYLKRCHAAGQTRPTPLLLRYGAGDYNCLHQDLYGEHVFPLQATILLSEPGRDFEGG